LSEWVICFDFPDRGGIQFAAPSRNGALGFAPSVATAIRFESAEAAWRTLENGYADTVREFGRVVEMGAA
jgi:hypothetical protein